MKDSLLNVHFVRLATFERAAKGLFSDDVERKMEQEIATDPGAAPVVRGTGGVQKIRVALEGRGKRGSARVIYLYIAEAETIYLLWAFPKNVSANLTDVERKIIRKLVASLKAEHER